MNDRNPEIYEYEFDYQNYIERRLREIDDLDERKFGKKLLLEGMGKVIQCMENKYQQLERRIYEEINVTDAHYEVCMTVINRQDFDPINPTLFPVLEEDLKCPIPVSLTVDLTEIHVNTVFLKLPETECRCLEKIGRFTGCVTVDGYETTAWFSARPSKRYQKQVEHLYELFHDNQVPWRTVNTGYLDKFYDIYLEINSINISEHGKLLEKVMINFEEFQPFIEENRIPLWNIQKIKFKCNQFMMPCINEIYYEHEFTLEEDRDEDGYLIQFNEDILEIRHESQKIVIKSTTDIYENWIAFRFVQAKPALSLGYEQPFLTNHRKDSFSRRYLVRSGVYLMTKADLFRRIIELDIQNYIEIYDYEICDKFTGTLPERGMNWFVRDELFPLESRKALVLKFKETASNHYLNDSIVRFVISQLQLEISEYRCVGVIK